MTLHCVRINNNKLLYKVLKLTLYTITFCLLVFLSFIFRSYEFEKTSMQVNGNIPFAVYSLEKITNIQNIVENNVTAKVSQNYPKAMDYLIAYSYKFKQFINNNSTNHDLTSFTKNNLILYASLVSGIIFLLLTSLISSYYLSFLGGALFAVSAAAINESFGLSITSLNLSLMLFLLLLLFYIKYRDTNNKSYLILTAFSLYASLAVSQLSQINLFVFGIYIVFSSIFFKEERDINKKISITLLLTSLTAGLTIPFLYNVSFIISPVIIIILPLTILFSFYDLAELKRKYYLLTTFILLIVFWSICFYYSDYAINYSNILSLFIDKITLSNIKPLTPKSLSFANRILWDIPFRSASFDSYWQLFHFFFYFYLLILFIIFLYPGLKKIFFSKIIIHSLFILFIIIYFLLFIYFQRVSVYVAALTSISLIVLSYDIQKNLLNKVKYVIPIVLTLLFLIESLWTLTLRPKNFYQHEVNKYVSNWASTVDLSKKNILCDYSIAPILKNYSKANCFLSENINSKDNIKNVEIFYNIMYTGTENDLAKFCSRNKIDYLIYSKSMALGNVEEKHLYPFSMRYIGNCFIMQEDSPAYKMYYTPLKLKLFYNIDQQLPYSLKEILSVYKVILPKNIPKAKELTIKAQYYFDNASLDKAKKLINEAIEIAPNLANTRFLYYQIYNKWPFVTLDGVKGQKLDYSK